MPIITIPRVLGGTLIINVNIVVNPTTPTVTTTVAYGRDGKVIAKGRDGLVTAKGR